MAYRHIRKLPRQGDTSKVEILAAWERTSAGVRSPRACL